MSDAIQSLYGSEDGDEWFADGHLDPEQMIQGALAWERDLGNTEDLPDADQMEVTHYWVIECEFNEEAYHIVAEGTPKAKPMTRAR